MQLRYDLETYRPLYPASPHFDKCLDELVQLQGVLGSLRDIEVSLELAPEAAESPALLAVLKSDYERHWAAFVARREAALRPELRSNFLAALFQPTPVALGVGAGL